jgi:PTH2 family peptidyl-tRNA hydrolase
MIKQVIILRKDLNMRKGKIAAQAAHASLGVFSNKMDIEAGEDGLYGKIPLTSEEVSWFKSSYVKIGLYVDSLEDLLDIKNQAKKLKLNYCLIEDNGTTEFKGKKTITALAIGPNEAEVIDIVTGHLKLY